jgi:hypothetical protein
VLEAEKSFWIVERGQPVRLTTSPSSVSQLFREREILNISQPNRPPRPVTGITIKILHLRQILLIVILLILFPRIFMPVYAAVWNDLTISGDSSNVRKLLRLSLLEGSLL